MKNNHLFLPHQDPVLVRHRVDGQEQSRQVAVVVPRSEVGEARLAVPFLAGESGIIGVII